MAAGAWAEDRNLQLEATVWFRKLLPIERSPPIEEAIELGVVPHLVQFLTREYFPQLQFEAAWALTNIVSETSDNTKVVIDLGAVPIFVKRLGSPADDIREQTIWALGNIAGDSPECRDLVLGHGTLPTLLAQFNEHAKLSMLRNATWTLSNFCRGNPRPSFDLGKTALPVLQQLIRLNDVEILIDACWAISYLSDGSNDKIQAIIDADICPRLVFLLISMYSRHPSPSVLVPALRAVGNVITGDDMQTQLIIDYRALPCLQNFLSSNFKRSIKKEACWAFSNITAGNSEQIQAVINADIIGPLVHLLQHAEFDIKKEAAWTISKLHLAVGEAEKVLGCPGAANIYADMIEEAEGVDKIEGLQVHDNTKIYKKAVKILETYWLEEGEELVAPGDTFLPGFQFGKIEASVLSGGFKFI